MTDSDPQSAPSPPPPPPQPTWRPPEQRDGNAASIVVGVILLAIGVWYFLDQTLGLVMPRVRWGDLWPIFLIVIGGVILIRSAGRRA
jgi:hypothetical protein